MNRLRLFIIAVGLLLATLVLSQTSRVVTEPQDQGKNAPTAPNVAFALQPGATPTPLKSMQGKVVLVDFWASWCGPCKMSIPVLEKVYEKYKDQGLVVIGVSEDAPTTRGDVPATAKSLGITYPVNYALDNPQLSDQFNHEGIPALFAIDKRGTIRWTESGFSPSFDLDGSVAKLLAEEGP